MVTGKPLPSSSDSAHDLITHHHNTVLGKQSANPLEIALWGRNKPIGSGHRLKKHSSDIIRVLVENSLFKLTNHEVTEFLIRHSFTVKKRTIFVGVKHPNNPGHTVSLIGPPPRVTREHHGSVGATMISLISSNYFATPSVQLCKLKSVLIGLSASKCEKEFVEVTWSVFSQKRAKLCSDASCHSRACITKFICLIFNSLNNFWMRVANISAH
mmetsp:Transcript_8558/g.12775  ORF Transcript_8558/g.12775 Transcript_8558/m.12775 type:complete len:213 (+) Transcript_8558:704-1342(+)